MKVQGKTLPVHELTANQPSEFAELLASATEDDFSGVFRPDLVEQMRKQTGWPLSELMLRLGSIAKLYAYAPISKFHVGAVALGSSGALYLGCNLEFPGQALSFVTHAEQSAITHARYRGEPGVEALAISAAPCGYCRQFLNELREGSQLTIHLSTGSTTLGTLLPDSFGPEELKNTSRLLDPQDHHLTLDSHRQEDSVIRAAIDAANTSYAPYSSNFSGVALETSSNQIFAGSYEENVAANPSLSPMEAALTALNFSGLGFTDIARAVLVENADSQCSQQSATSAVLAAVAPAIRLEYFTATSTEPPMARSER